jgi:GTP-binding protein
MKKKGTSMVPVDIAGAGDIISMAGLTTPAIGHTVANVEVNECILILYPQISCVLHYFLLGSLGKA